MPMMKDCINACDLAHRAATEAAIHAMQQGGKLADWELVQLLLDTADICETAADFLLRSSRQYTPVLRVASEIADKCADACEKLAPSDLRMKECAQSCRRAATQCRKLL
ncbi:four-helix bundle copper-binding protein [Magnetospirillum sulfuroxidans]|uniref:Four-helix bundle copper-binding protein n=1 Tax=Magnetospirillum sulfuroxidans TaxID=611300 RepID=A0ABS5I8H4_9PROT|nr:four-helix bundle copper-binding protein [Magnetospirillum sulfuroxidans]MBR9970738.1 four-helix bundle copper-binding protein [Magnetospirillum sulfuroxidans]